MPNTPEVSSPPLAKTTNRFGARAVLAAVALALVAVPGALTLWNVPAFLDTRIRLLAG